MTETRRPRPFLLIALLAGCAGSPADGTDTPIADAGSADATARPDAPGSADAAGSDDGGEPTGPRPSRPESPMAVGIDASTIRFSWSASSPGAGGASIVGYFVWAGDAEAGPWTELTGGTPTADTSIEEPGLAEGQTRWYRARAVDADGAQSPSTTAVSATTLGGGGGGECELPPGTWDGRRLGGASVLSSDWGPGLYECAQWICRSPHCAERGSIPPTDQVRVVTVDGRTGGEFTVRPGDEDSARRRSIHLECVADLMNYDGDDRYYAFSVFLPDDFAPNENYNIIHQFHSSSWAGLVNPQAAMSIERSASTGELEAVVSSLGGLVTWERGTTQPTYEDVRSDRFPVGLGVWNDFILHVRWSAGTDGRYEVWHRTSRDAAFTRRIDWSKRTLLVGENADGTFRGPEDARANTKFGLYVGVDQIEATTIVHHGFHAAETLDVVARDFGCSPP